MSLDEAVGTRPQVAVPDEHAPDEIRDTRERLYGFLWLVAAVQLVWIVCLAYAAWFIVA